MTKLVLLGGPTGVGKTTVMRILQQRLSNAALLDADDVWRVSAEVANEDNRATAISNVISVMRGYFLAGCSTGVLAWVFARSALYQPVIDGIGDLVDEVDQVYLMASPAELKSRLIYRGDESKCAYALSRWELINALPYPKIDSTHMTPDEVATTIILHLETPSS